MATSLPRTPAKTNYLNNRDILKQIHLSKNTYCTYLDPVADHQYDIILPTLSKINQRTVAEARRNRADRLKREGVIIDPKKDSKYRSSISYYLLGPHTHGRQKGA